ncbi:lipopolysaccharide biosynthesis protein [Nocardioides zeae]|uniref:Oligosaccharide flippase family protein n=1 Tax=Nocardioides zeae TaxID=1457234 RepID=A0A6P0HNT9_9ACTN|nr:hypothetical protein [Nocardioides zeae]NEN79970.1 hypothetical protein [Nocardioides zeae]
MRLSRFQRTFALITGGKIAGALLQAASLALLASFMDVAEFGRFFVVVSITYLAMTPFEFGFGTLALRIKREDDPGGTLAAVLALRCTTTALTIGLTFVGCVLSFENMSPSLILAATIWATSEAVGNLSQNLYVGLLRENVAIAFLLARRAVLVAALLLGQAQRVSSPTELILFACGLSLVAGPALLSIHASLPMQSPIKLLSSRRRFWLTGLGDNLRQLDTVIVMLLAGPVVTGYFAAASRLVAPLGILTSSLMQSMIPEMVRRGKEDTSQFLRSALRYMTLVAAVLALASSASPILMTVVYGSEFGPSWPIAAAIIFGAGLTAMNQTILAWEVDQGLSGAVTVIILLSTFLYLTCISAASFASTTYALAVGILVSGMAYHLALRFRFVKHFPKAEAT